MMKNVYKWASLALAAVLMCASFTACDDDDEEVNGSGSDTPTEEVVPTISLNYATLSIPASGAGYDEMDNAEIELQAVVTGSTTAPTVSCSITDGWTVEAYSGNPVSGDDDELTYYYDLFVDENTTSEAIECTITFTIGDVSASMVVTQAAAEEEEVTITLKYEDEDGTAVLTIPASGSSYDDEGYADYELYAIVTGSTTVPTVSCDQDSFSVVPVEGNPYSEEGTLGLTYYYDLLVEANTTSEPIVCNVTFTVDNVSKTIVITQSATEATLTLNKTSFEVEYYGSGYDEWDDEWIQFSATVTGTEEVPTISCDKEGVTVNPRTSKTQDDGSIVYYYGVIVDENTATEVVVYTITVSVADLSATVTITQAAAEEEVIVSLQYENETISIPADGAGYDEEGEAEYQFYISVDGTDVAPVVQCDNTAFTIELFYSGPAAMGTATEYFYAIIADANPTSYPRTGTVEVTVGDYYSGYLYISQETSSTGPIVEVGVTEIVLTADAYGLDDEGYGDYEFFVTVDGSSETPYVTCDNDAFSFQCTYSGLQQMGTAMEYYYAVIVDANTSDSPRTGTITVTVGDYSTTISVVQASASGSTGEEEEGTVMIITAADMQTMAKENISSTFTSYTSTDISANTYYNYFYLDEDFTMCMEMTSSTGCYWFQGTSEGYLQFEDGATFQFLSEYFDSSIGMEARAYDVYVIKKIEFFSGSDDSENLIVGDTGTTTYVGEDTIGGRTLYNTTWTGESTSPSFTVKSSKKVNVRAIRITYEFDPEDYRGYTGDDTGGDSGIEPLSRRK